MYHVAHSFPLYIAIQNLLKLHERQESIVADLRAKLKHLRQESAAREKQLDLAHRTIERLSVNKQGLEAGEAAKKAYIRQLEARVSGMQSNAELLNRCQELKAQVDSLQEKLRTAEEQSITAQEIAKQHQEESQFLKRGIQLAADQLTRSTNGDAAISSTMLLAVARGQEEAIDLANQLAESKEKLNELTSALSIARNHLQAQHEALVQWQEWETAQSEKVEGYKRLLVDYQNKQDVLKNHAEKYKQIAKEAIRERDAARYHLELEKTARNEAEHSVHVLQQEIKHQEESMHMLRDELSKARQAMAHASGTMPHRGAVEGGGLGRTATTKATTAATTTKRRTKTSNVVVDPAQQQHVAAARPRNDGFTGKGRATEPVYALDEGIARLEIEIARLAPPSTGAPSRPSVQGASSIQERLPAQQWRTNPLASMVVEEQRQNPMQSDVDASICEHDAQDVDGAVHPANSEEAAWNLLHKELEQQRQDDRRFMKKWRAIALSPDGTTAMIEDDEEEEDDDDGNDAVDGTTGDSSPSRTRDASTVGPQNVSAAARGQGGFVPRTISATHSDDAYKGNSNTTVLQCQHRGGRAVNKDGKETDRHSLKVDVATSGYVPDFVASSKVLAVLDHCGRQTQRDHTRPHVPDMLSEGSMRMSGNWLDSSVTAGQALREFDEVEFESTKKEGKPQTVQVHAVAVGIDTEAYMGVGNGVDRVDAEKRNSRAAAHPSHGQHRTTLFDLAAMDIEY